MGDSRKLDRVLGISALVLGIAVLGLAGYFGYSVYTDRMAAQEATPAGRIAKVIAEQVKKSPNDAVLRVRYGEALAAAGREKDAVEQFNAALKIDPKHTGAMIDLGQLALNQKETGTAARYYRQVVELTSGSSMEDVNQRREVALYQLGRIALSNNEFDDAIGYFKSALRIRNDASDTYYYLARALDGSGDVDEALTQLEIAVRFDPNFAEARYFLGDLYIAQGDKVQASYNYGRAAQLAPDAPEPQAAIAKFGSPDELIAKAKTLMKSDPEAALEAARIARNIDSDNAEAAKVVALVLNEQGDFKLALATYKEAQQLAPDDPAIKSAIEQLSKKIKSEAKAQGK